MSNTREKDKKLAVLFGLPEDDLRSSLFISELRRAADSRRGNSDYKKVTYTLYTTDNVLYKDDGNIYLDNLTEMFMNGNFKNPGSGVANNEIHEEWTVYFMDINRTINDTRFTFDNNHEIGKNVIKLMTELASKTILDSEDHFAIQLIGLLIGSVNYDTTGTGKVGPYISDSHHTWNNIKSITYRNFLHDVLPTFFVCDFDSTYSFKKNVTTNKLDILQLNIVTNTRLQHIYNNINRVPTSYTKSNNKIFNIKLDELALKRILDEHLKNKIQPINNPISDFFNDEPQEKEQYYRKGDELYTKDKSGKELRVDAESEAYKKLSTTTTCLGTNFKDDPAKPTMKCSDYLIGCLSGKGDSINLCKEYLKHPNFWDNSQKEIDDMLPTIAVKTLNSFMFQFIKDPTTGIIQVWSVTDWIKHLHELAKQTTAPTNTSTKGSVTTTTTTTIISDEDVGKIVSNVKLIGYLEMLVRKINTNPAILNKDYTGPNKINNTNMFANTYLNNIGMQSFHNGNIINNYKEINLLQQTLRTNFNNVDLFHRIRGSVLGLGFRGGGSILDTFQENLSDKTKHISHIIRRHHISLLDRLARLGKTIDQTEQKKIIDLIDKLEVYEQKLYKAAVYTEKYAQLLETHGQSDNNKVLTFDNLIKFVDHRNTRFNRVYKKQNDLLNILKAIAEAVVNEQQQRSPPNTAQPTKVPYESISSYIG
jgi:hypothetical protein